MNKNNDLFAPPTDDELSAARGGNKINIPDMSSSSSQEPDLISKIISKGKDTAIGLGQGLTYGGGAKGLAALEAATDIATGQSKPTDKWQDLYNRYKGENEKGVAEAHERSPYLYNTGEIAGALASPINKIAAPVAGLAGLGEAAGIGGTLARGAVEGATLGGTAGAINQGESETMPHAILKGALTGAGWGTAGSAVAKAGQAAFGGAKKALTIPGTELGDTNAALYKEGQAGRGITTKKSLLNQGAVNDQAAADAARQLVPAKEIPGQPKTLSQREAIRNEYTNVLKQHIDPTNGQPLPIDIPNVENGNLPGVKSITEQYPYSFTGPEGNAFKKRLNDAIEGNISAPDAHALKLDLFGHPLASQPETGAAFNGAAAELNGALATDVPGYAQANKDWKSHNQILESLNGVPSDLNQKLSSNDPNLNNSIVNKFQTMVNGLGAPGVSKLGPKSDWNNFSNEIANVAKTNPDFIQKYGQFLPQLKQDIENRAIVQGGVKQVQGTGQLGAAGQLFGSLTPKSLSYTGANALGQASAGVGFPGGVSKIVNAPPQVLHGLADTLTSNPATKVFGDSLKNSLSQPTGSMARTAALFNIMQNPNTRKVVDGDDNGNK